MLEERFPDIATMRVRKGLREDGAPVERPDGGGLSDGVTLREEFQPTVAGSVQRQPVERVSSPIRQAMLPSAPEAVADIVAPPLQGPPVRIVSSRDLGVHFVSMPTFAVAMSRNVSSAVRVERALS